MEGVFDEFFKPEAVCSLEDEDEEPVIDCVGEVVSSTFGAKKTMSKEQKEAFLHANYGDLPRELWEGRYDQEAAWIAPGETDNIIDLDSGLLPHPDRTIIIGTNGTISFALQCADDDTIPFDKERLLNPEKKPNNRDELIAIVDNYHAQYSRVNVAFDYKRRLSEFEGASFYLALKYDIESNIHLQGDAKLLVERLTDMARVDSTLRSTISRVGTRLDKRRKKLPISFDKEHSRPKVQMAERPGGCFAMVQFMMTDFHDQNGDDTIFAPQDASTTFFRLLVCRTPTQTSSSSSSSGRGKKPGWIDTNIGVLTDAKTVPACAFNDTHFCILYLPHTVTRNAVIFVDMYKIPDAAITPGGNKPKLTHVDRFAFRFPPQFANQGMINVHLSDCGIMSVCFANGVLVFDTLRMVPGIHVILLELAPSDKETKKTEEEERRLRRRITTASIFHPAPFPRPSPEDYLASATKETAKEVISEKGKEEEEEEEKEAENKRDIWCGTIVLGTDKGECYGINWRTGKVIFIEATPGVEPIFTTHYSNGKIFLHSVMAITASIPDLSSGIPQMTILPMDRPVSMHTCGSLIFVVSKYGFVKVFSSIARKVAREFPPPVTGSKTPLLQHAYRGVRAYTDHLVIVYPSGMVRNLILTKTIKKEDIPK
jgi:hypothetical protein